MAEDILQRELGIIQCQFLSGYNSKLVNWQFWSENLTWNTQKALFDRTAGHKLNKTFPVKVNHQLSFLSQLLDILTSKSEDVHDDIYEHYCSLMQSKKVEFNYVHYCILQYNTTISLKEYQAFVGHGTTGLCSWDASLALSNWLLNNTNVVEGKTVIELGAGTGLSGLIASKCCNASEVILTDGSTKVIELLNENIQRNFECMEIKQDDSSMTHYRYNNHGEKNLKTLLLPWESIEEHKNNLSVPNVILAADVTYDPECLPALVHAIETLFKMASNKCIMIMIATIRNETTISEFQALLRSKDFNLGHRRLYGPEHLYWRKDASIQLFIFTKTIK